MRRLFHSPTIILFGALPAYAQVGMPWPGPGTAHSVAAGYSGPGNLVSGATVFWGLRAYSSAQADGTHAAIHINRASDGRLCDVLLNTSGQLGVTANCSVGGDNGTSNVIWCNATTCYVDKFYDQTGNGNDAPQVGAGASPIFNPSATISSQNVTWSGSNKASYCTAGTVSTPQINSVSTVYNWAGGTADQAVFGGAVTQVGNEDTNLAYLYDGSIVTAAATASADHAVQAIFNGSSSKLYIDGSATTGLNPGAGSSTAAQMCIGGSTGSLNLMNGTIREVGIWPNAAAASFDSNLSNLNSNAHTYWGF